MNTNDCQTTGACGSSVCKIAGIVFLIIATLLTLYTLNGAGIFGMFIAGVFFCCHKHCNKSCYCPCCEKKDSGCVTECAPTPKSTKAK